MHTLRFQRALITGASSGIGRGLSLWFSKRGVRVFAGARRIEALSTLQEEASVAGGYVETVQMDVTRTEALVDQIRQLDTQCGGFDLVIANAGVGEDSFAQTVTWKNIEETLQVNVMGAAATLAAALPSMVARNHGHLVGISSVAAYRGLPRHAAYCGSKAFLKVFLESLRVDLRSTGVQVSSLHPGYVKTDLTARNRFRMPFLLDLDDACERMGRAILAGKAEFTFPWPMALGAQLLRLVPNWIYDRVAPSFGQTPRKLPKQT